MKYWKVFLVLIMVSCTSKDDRVVAIVNGKQIKIKRLKDEVSKENWNRKYLENYVNELIKKEVVLYEANRLSLSEGELFSFFEILKTRSITEEELNVAFNNELKEIQGKTKGELVQLLQDRQYEKAKELYIKELKDRSTVRLYLNQLDESL